MKSSPLYELTSMEVLKVALFFCFLLPLLILTHAGDTLSINQSLPDGITIISSGGVFELGFFSPDNSINRYLGIWLKKVTKFTVVWVANRDSPLNAKSGVLKINEQGILTILNTPNGSTNIWSSSNFSTRAVQNPIAQLLDSGNLIVRDSGDDNPDNFLWQSFDHLTNVVLPGVKFGLNLVTGIDRKIQSWKSNNDPSSGDYIFRMDLEGVPQEYLTKDSVTIFRSGPWNGLRWSGSPGLKPNSIYTYEFVNTPREIYYKFDLINPSTYTILCLNPTGTLQRLTWNYNTQDWTTYLNAPADNCDRYGLCHEYGICNIPSSPVCNCLDKFVPKSLDDWKATDWSSGCVRRKPLVRNTSLDCRKGEGFKKYSGIKLPDTRLSWYNQNITLDDCKETCLNNCSCMAYANADVRGKGSGCILWFDDLIDIVQLSANGEDIYIRLASSEIGSSSHGGKIVGISLGVIGVALLLLLLILALHIKKRRQEKRQTEQLVIDGNVERSSGYLNPKVTEPKDLDQPLFDLVTIVKATNNFSKDNKLGEGGFGPVYKGVLDDGHEIAVKRLSEFSIQGIDEFKNEVDCIAKLQHRNLVKLLGCCIQSEEKMLIYEFMPNKSLDYFIFDKTRSTLLDWPMRYEIIMGIARGMLYLHQDSRLRIIHRDLKAANILLDSDMKPKISDFGMARIFGGTETEASTNRVVGTYGYMSPEYVVDGYFSTMSDVFSFGVLVLEIISGKKNRGFSHPDHHHNLLGHAWLLYKEGRHEELIDPCVIESCNMPEVLRSIHVALLCVQQNPEDRLKMSNVVLMLASEGSLPMPNEPGFFTERNMFFEPESSSGKREDTPNSGNYSITLLDPR